MNEPSILALPFSREPFFLYLQRHWIRRLLYGWMIILRICKHIFVTWYLASEFELSNGNVTTVCILTEVSDFAIIKIHNISKQFLLQ